MFIFLLVPSSCFDFIVRQTTLFISGTGRLAREELMANCDFQIITEIHVGEGCTSFENLLFYNFISLRNLYLPSTLQNTIGTDTRYCWSLANIFLAEENQYLELDQFGALYNKGQTQLIRFPPKKAVKNFCISPLTVIIGTQAFQGCATIPELIIPKKIEMISSGFIYDSQISRVIYEKGSPITSINNFQYNAVQYVFIAKNVALIESGAFDYAQKLEIVEFEDGSNLTEIRNMAFSRTRIKTFIFPPKCTKIGSALFNLDISLNSIHIPESLIEINVQAFVGAPNIQTITIDEKNPIYTVISPSTLLLKNKTKYMYFPSSIERFRIEPEVIEFGYTIFQSCTSLVNVSVDPNNKIFTAYEGIIYSIGYKRAIACIGGISEAKLRTECEEIGNYCLYKCRKLTSIILNSGVTILGSQSFFGINLTELDIPSTVEKIQNECFQSAIIKNVKTNGKGPKNIGTWAFFQSNIENINFGSDLTTLGTKAFYDSKIQNVKFNDLCPLSVIEYQTFIYCRSIRTVIIPKNVLKIAEGGFCYCSSLSTIVFAESSKISYIDTLCFRQTNISSILLPQSLTYLGANAFSECRNLRSIIFEQGMNLKNLGGGAFRSCISLPTVTIPASVLLFDPSAFVFCSNLMSINVPNENLNYKSVDGIVYNKLNDKLICCPGGRVNAMIFKHIIVIGSNAFYGCSKLENLTFEEGCRLEVIEDGTFFSCTSLRRVDLPTSLITVQQSAFSGCTLLAIITFTDYARADLGADSIFADCVSLTTISFGRFCALKNLGSSIFSNCIKLKTINIPANCTKIGDGAFSGCKSLSDIRFESNSNLKYLSSSAFVGCTSLLTYNVPDSFKEITSACFGGAQSITTVNIASMINIDRIGPNAFSSIPMTRINIGLGTTISLIDEYAFQNTRISSLEILSSVIISRYSFKGCSLLRTISVPLATSIWNNAFEGCTMLESFSIENTVTISSFVFKGCTNLRSVKIPKLISEQSSITIFSASPSSSMRMRKRILSTGSTSTIPIGLFDGCKSLSSLTIRNNIESISDYCFRDCISLIYDIPRTVTMIGNESFKNCIKVNNIPSDVQYFGNMSFYGTNIKKVILINRYTTYIGSSSFENTPLRIIFYCGNRDFSNFDKSFEDDSQVVVTYAYEQSTFCGSHAYHIQSNMCNDIMATNYDRIDILKKELKSHMKKNLLFLCAIDPLGLW